MLGHPLVEKGKAVIAVKSYSVHYVLGDDGLWTASVREVRGAHTQGRSIAQARRRIREALSLFVGNARSAVLVDHIRVDAGTRTMLREATAARARAVRQQRAASRSVARVVKKLTGQMSIRDAGEILGVSPQRVQQLASV
jgi:predicted RNase H-like HicB family nuclease